MIYLFLGNGRIHCEPAPGVALRPWSADLDERVPTFPMWPSPWHNGIWSPALSIQVSSPHHELRESFQCVSLKLRFASASADIRCSEATAMEKHLRVQAASCNFPCASNAVDLTGYRNSGDRIQRQRRKRLVVELSESQDTSSLFIFFSQDRSSHKQKTRIIWRSSWRLLYHAVPGSQDCYPMTPAASGRFRVAEPPIKGDARTLRL